MISGTVMTKRVDELKLKNYLRKFAIAVVTTVPFVVRDTTGTVGTVGATGAAGTPGTVGTVGTPGAGLTLNPSPTACAVALAVTQGEGLFSHPVIASAARQPLPPLLELSPTNWLMPS